ncbi:hypothetical protein [Roseivirga thermotolerans]|uniref:LTD domain-containing protein n=1 Tax=Roseivirga thermotolerans TaxID=1758176 RepID=A0ABQ3I5M4_9BACT|nr:hypothetical protein [Roseivirga thermotolerans]GHE55760.1 hypothetical protein GCM10011340_08170 [Roseivirga thermotolerans]
MSKTIAQKFAKLQFDFVNAVTNNGHFLIDAGSAMNQLQLTITNQGTSDFPWTGNDLDIDLSNFLSETQFSKVEVATAPTGWSGQVIKSGGIGPGSGSYILRLSYSGSGSSTLKPNDSLTFLFDKIDVTDPNETTGNWINVMLHPSQNSTPKPIAFSAISLEESEMKKVNVQWATGSKGSGVIYKTADPTPHNNHRTFELYNNSDSALDSDWQSKGKSPVFVVAFQPGITQNAVASADYIKDFDITLADTGDQSNWTIKKKDASAAVGLKIWEIRPTTNNTDILAAKSSLKLNITLATDAALTPMQDPKTSFAHSYMYINQVNIGATTAYTLPITKEQAPTLTFSATQPDKLQITSAPNWKTKLSWTVTNNPQNLDYKLSLFHNNNPISLPTGSQNDSTSVELTKGNNSLELQLELLNPNFTITKTVNIQLNGVVPTALDFGLQGKLSKYQFGNIVSVAPYEYIKDKAHWVVVADDQTNLFYSPIVATDGIAFQEYSPYQYSWFLPNPGVYGGVTVMNTEENRVALSTIYSQNAIIGTEYINNAPLPIGAIATVGGTMRFDGSQIHHDWLPAGGLTVPNAPLNYGNCFISAQNTSEKNYHSNMLILIKSSTNPHDWLAYSQSENAFLNGSTSSYDHSTPTWMGNKLIFIMNNPKNPTTPVWGLYEHDFSGQNVLITNLFGLGNDTYIAHVEYLSDPQYLLMWDTTGFLWVLDCASGYELLTTSTSDLIWKENYYPTISSPNANTYLVSDGKSNAAIFDNSDYKIILAAHFF